MPSVLKGLFGYQVTVTEQNRTRSSIRFKRHRVGGQYIRSVWEVSDFAKTFRLTLGAISALRTIKTLQRSIFLRANAHTGLQFKLVRHQRNKQLLIRHLIVVLAQSLAIKLDPLQRQLLTIELQGRGRRTATHKRQGRRDVGSPRKYLNRQRDCRHGKIGRLIIHPADRSG